MKILSLQKEVRQYAIDLPPTVSAQNVMDFLAERYLGLAPTKDGRKVYIQTTQTEALQIERALRLKVRLVE